MGGGEEGGVQKLPPWLKFEQKCYRLEIFNGVYPLYLPFKNTKMHALSAEYLLMTGFFGQNYPEFFQNWTIFKLLYLGNRSR